jgi:hypothetical protein
MVDERKFVLLIWEGVLKVSGKLLVILRAGAPKLAAVLTPLKHRSLFQQLPFLKTLDPELRSVD